MTAVVVRALGLITIQDLGRPGHMHEAIPPGGALVPERLIAANRLVRNPDDAPALEVLGTLTIRAERRLEVATDSDDARVLAAGAELTVVSEPRRVAYLAVRGGVASPLVLGGRGALLCAGLGGRLRAGQELAVAELSEVAPARAPDPQRDPQRDPAIRIVAGPDPTQFGPGALDALTSAPYRILPSSDRVGTRLDGPAIPRTAAPEASRPMVLGAIEVPRDGQPIVLGPEHPTTGGYPIIAVIAHADLGRLFSIRLGGSVWFTRSTGTR
jgi:5-oxoprolinase (ATP-hydrolysing) subunit C